MFVLYAIAAPLSAQTPDAFNPGADYLVDTLAVQPDGRVLVGGSFGALGGQPCSSLGRLNEDGTLDVTFNAGASGGVIALAVQADGKIIAGGSLGTLGGKPRSKLGRLYPNGLLDLAFDPGANSTVYCLAVQADGKILAGGNFTQLAGQTRTCIGRLNPDGTLDAAFNPGAGSDVYALAVQPDGKILAGGVFPSLGGQTRNYLGRLNANGTLDSSFNPGANSSVLCLAVQKDGKILVGGYFTTLGGQTCNGLGRLNADGTLDPAFANPAVGPSAINLAIHSLALQADGKILAGGLFDTIGEQPRHSIVRLNADGTVDPTFDAGASYTVYALAVQADGKIVAGGQFTTLGGQPRQYIGRLNNTGSATQELAFDGASVTWRRGGTSPEVWRTSFDFSTNGNDWVSLGAGQRITEGWRPNAIVPATNASLRARGFLAAGRENAASWFVETISGPVAVSQPPVGRTNNAGTLASFRVLAGGTAPLSYQWYKDGVALNDTGKNSGVHDPTLLVSNVFGADAGAYSVVVGNASGSVMSAVAALVVQDPFIISQPSGYTVNAGQTVSLSMAAGGAAPLSYCWRKDGTNLPGWTTAAVMLTNVQWADRGGYDVVVSNTSGSVTSAVAVLTVNLALPDSFNPGVNAEVRALALQTDGKVLVGGRFTNLANQVRRYLGRLNADGTLDTAFTNDTSGGTYPAVNAVALQPDGRILVGGDFTALGGQPRANLGRLNADGTLDNSFNPGATAAASPSVSALALQPDGSILVAGHFTSLGGQAHTGLGRLKPDGTVDGTFNPVLGGAPDPSLSAVAVQADGKILVGGLFTTLNGQPRNRIGRLNANGTVDPTFNPGVDLNVLCLAVQADGKILVGGNFSALGGQPRSNLGRLNPNGSLDLAFNPGASWTVYSLAVQADGSIWVGGVFTSLAGQACSYLGRLNPEGALDSRLNVRAGGIVNAVALQSDGKLLAGGSFWTLAAQFRYGLGRLNNPDLVTQELTFNGSSVTWRRNGASPEIGAATFEASTNRTDWFPLGAGQRNGEGWQLTEMALPADASVRARGLVAGGYYNGSAWLVEQIAGAPMLASQPRDCTTNAGTVATFSVRAGGTEPLSYQWLKDGASLGNASGMSGAQTPTLTLSNILSANAGSYAVLISNQFGSVTSAVAALTVVEPWIASQPASQLTNLGPSVTFSVSAFGTAPLSYQWRKNGTNLAGATAASLTLTHVQITDGGNFDVLVSNPLGCVTSTVASLRFIASPDLLTPSANSNVRALAVQGDGRLLLGGDFTSLGGQTRNRIGRLNADGSLDSGFNPVAGGGVEALAVQEDGKILVAGSFTTLAGQTRNRVGRLNPDGTLDAGFNPGASGTVHCLALQADGKVLLGGDFGSLGGQPRSYLGRLNLDGTLDATFNPGAGGPVYALAVQPDGKVLVGGNFTSLGGVARSYLGRLGADGSLDTTFNPGANATVYTLTLRADSKLLVGGTFTTLGGQTRTALGLLNPDGTLDTSFNARLSGSATSVLAIGLQADGKLLLGGNFTSIAWQTRNNLGRLNADGSLDTAFNLSAGGTVYALAVLADGNLLVGGAFSTLGGWSRTYFGRANNSDPASQTLAFAAGRLTWMRSGTSPEVSRTSFDYSTNGSDWVHLGSGARIDGGWELAGIDLPEKAYTRARGFVVGGEYNGSAWFTETLIGPPLLVLQPVSRTNNAGTVATFSALGTGSALSYQWCKDGVSLLDGGNISGAQTATLRLNNVLRADAGAYSVILGNNFGSITSLVASLSVVDPVINTPPYRQHAHAGQTVNFNVSAMGTLPLQYQWRKNGAKISGATTASLVLTNVVWADGGNYDVVVNNGFGCVTSTVAALSVNLVVADAANPGTDGQVLTMAVNPDGKVLMGGSFTNVDGQPRTNLARLNVDGTLDTSFSAGTDGFVLALALQPDGKLLVGGFFTRLGGLLCTNLGRLYPDGTPDETFQAGANTTVSFLLQQPDGKMLVGGRFTALAGQPRNYLGRLNADGTLDTTFTAGANDWVHALALQPDGKILVGGRFTTLAGQPCNYLGRLNADGTLDTAFVPTPDNWVHALALQPDGKILVGGDFTILGGQGRSRIGRLNPDGSLDTQFNPGAEDRVTHFALQADGQIVVGGCFISLGGQTRYFLGRLAADGTLDAAFSPDPNANPWSLALQTDGKLAVGGWFGSIGGQPRNHFARLATLAPPTQSLSFDSSGITWLRGGTGPEVWLTSFESSTDATNWTTLGTGTRIANGWQLSGASFPENAIIRARGFLTGGGSTGGASWFIESVATRNMPLTILLDEGSFGLNSNGFGFSLRGDVGRTVIVEGSTNLLDWIPLQTNLLDTLPVYFRDSSSLLLPSRFYRLRSPSDKSSGF